MWIRNTWTGKIATIKVSEHTKLKIKLQQSFTKLVYIFSKRAAFEFRQENDDVMVFDATLSTLCVSKAIKSETDFHKNCGAESAPRPSTALKEDFVHFAKVLKAMERDSVSRG